MWPSGPEMTGPGGPTGHQLAGVLARHQAPLDVVLAGLLHAAYQQGESATATGARLLAAVSVYAWSSAARPRALSHGTRTTTGHVFLTRWRRATVRSSGCESRMRWTTVPTAVCFTPDPGNGSQARTVSHGSLAPHVSSRCRSLPKSFRRRSHIIKARSPRVCEHRVTARSQSHSRCAL